MLMVDLPGSVYIYIFVSILGLCFGSFFNVAIYRWTHESPSEREWIVRSSHCPVCKHKLLWYHNIPVLSYLFLKGKCAFCNTRISPRYIVVEISTAIMFAATAAFYLIFNISGNHDNEPTLIGMSLALVVTSLLFLTFVTDLLKGLIPDNITIPLFIISLIQLFSTYSVSPSITSSIVSLLIFTSAFAVLWGLKVMGLGDVLFVAGVSFLLGLKLSAIFLCLSVLLGGMFSIAVLIYLMLSNRYKPGVAIPFGPFLSLSAYISYFFGDLLLSWYINYFL